MGTQIYLYFVSGFIRPSQIKYLEENVGALNVKFTKEEFQEIDAIAPKGAAAGTRYPEASMKVLNA
jgi:hypothetical protein